MPGLPASTTLFNLPMFPLINSAAWPTTPPLHTLLSSFLSNFLDHHSAAAIMTNVLMMGNVATILPEEDPGVQYHHL